MILDFKRLTAGIRNWLGKAVATPETDPGLWLSRLGTLPNPAPILRQMGRAEQVYHSILVDPHVIGDVRSIRGEFRSHSWRVVPGDASDARSMAAAELCEEYLATTQPNEVSDWLEVMWQMTAAILTGYRVHEPVWQLYTGRNAVMRGKLLPAELLDRPGARWHFTAGGAPVLLSKGNPEGVLVEPYQAIVSRHMPSTLNPYGIALLSSCFWPWTFKTGGWRYFVKYCERHGLPWPVGRYQPGAQDHEIDSLAEALANMIEAGYLVTQDGNGLELLTPSGSSGDLPQERLLQVCNREMSKALTGQAMVAELHNVGARAATETALTRQRAINDADRDIAAASMSQLFRWITLFNVGEDVAPPVLEFYKQEPAGKERAETYQLAANMGARPSRSAMLEELAIPQAADDEDALLPSARAAEPMQPQAAPNDPGQPATTGPAFLSGVPGYQFAAAAGMTEAEAVEMAARAADEAIEGRLIQPIYDMLVQFEADGRSLAEFRAELGKVVGELDDTDLRTITEAALQLSLAQGAAEAAEDAA